MGGSVNFPVGREGFSTTGAVAELLDAFTFPSIIALGTDIAALDGLPDYPVPTLVTAPPVAGDAVGNPGGAGEGPGSRLEGVRDFHDSATTAVAAMHRFRNRSAALNAVLVERLVSAAEAEATLLELDPWQREISKASLRAEIALLLTIPEGMASALMTYSADLVRHLPATMGQLAAGVLGWEHAVVIAEETSLLRQAHLPQDTIDAFEQLLLGKAEHATIHSFKEKARRARERSYPETLVPKTRRAYEARRLGISRSRDGMAWLSLYGPSPTVEAIWAQCTATAQAAQGPHETRTLTQLRADIAAALLLCQTLDANNIHTPAPAPAPAVAGDSGNNDGGSGADNRLGTGTGTAQLGSWFSTVGQEPDPCGGGAFPDPDTTGPFFFPGQIPVFDDPDYWDPAFREPDPRNQPDWQAPGQPPTLTPAISTAGYGLPGAPASGSNGAAWPGTGTEGTTLPAAVTCGVWPPLPTVTPVLLVPALSLLGLTDEPAWMSGAGPISIEVAKRMAANVPSFYRVLVDPISGTPLDAAPDIRRLSKAMKTSLLIRDEYCAFPGCNARAVNCDDDHLHAFATGGQTTLDNLEPLCHRHHQLKHHKDDKTRTGATRTNQSFERQTVHPRGWSPRRTPEGVEWTSPAGYHHPPEQQDTQPPVYNDWLKTLINSILHAQDQRHAEAQDIGDTGDEDHPDYDTTTTAPDWEYPPDNGEADEPDFEECDYFAIDEAIAAGWDPNKLPEEPASFIPSPEDQKTLDRLSIQDYLRNHHED